MEPENIYYNKKKLRKEIAARVRALPLSARERASAEIARQVLQLPEYRDAASIFLYIAMPTEPDTRAILTQALSDGKRVYVPKCVGDHDMLAVRVSGMDALRPGAYGIWEPQDCSETAEADALDLLIVPCVAASVDGRRLGHGKGYYDRFLAGGARKTVCLCFAAALCDAIPTEPTDVKMHRVVFETVQSQRNDRSIVF